jgi:hypothetical protein
MFRNGKSLETNSRNRCRWIKDSRNGFFADAYDCDKGLPVRGLFSYEEMKLYLRGSLAVALFDSLLNIQTL